MVKLIVIVNAVAVEKVVRKWIGVTESSCLRGSIVLLIIYFQLFLPIINGETTIC